jgi:hypothetical protein
VFRLSKWYFDVVSADGTVFIGYAARLAWGPVRLRYRAYLLSRPEGTLVARHTLVPTRDPLRRAGGRVLWRCGRLDLEGVWSSASASIRRRLYSDGAGAVDWDCVAPAARVRVRVGRDVLEGWGYAEHLEMTVPPWELPLDELRWGRFVGPGCALVWVDWRGQSPRRLVLLDGVEQPGGEVEDSVVTCGDTSELRLAPPRSLRSGPILDVVAAVPFLARAVPDRLLRGWESKRLSHGILLLEDQPAREGWVIHEVVRWASRVPV